MMSIKAECSALLAVLLASTTCYAAQPKIPPLNATPATTPAAIQAVRMHQADVELKQAQDACRHQPKPAQAGCRAAVQSSHVHAVEYAEQERATKPP